MKLYESSTVEILDSVEDAVRNASLEYEFAGSPEDAQMACARLTTKCESNIFRDVSSDLALKTAKQLGWRISLARYLNNPIEQITPLHDLAVLFFHIIVPDRDEARRRSTTIAEKACHELLELKDTERAAIAAMTSALSLMALSNPSREHLISAYQRLNKSYRWRQKGTSDSAYHNFNLSLARRRLVEMGEFERSSANFTRILKGFDRAQRLFEKDDENIDLAQYHENVIETLRPWLHVRVSEIESKYVEEIPDSELELPESNLVSTFKTIRANPGSFGFQKIPQWVPSEKAVLTEAVQSIPQFLERLKDAERYLKSNPEAHRLSTKLYELQQLLTPIQSTPEIPFAALDASWESEDYEEYLHNALATLGFVKDEQHYVERYAQVLQRVYLSFAYLRRSWPTERLHGLLEQYPSKLRFSACELAASGMWQEAFALLEESRGLRSSGTVSKLALDAGPILETQNDYLWVHVTHSPRGTYLICNRGMDYFGTEFTALSGDILAEYFAGFHPVGLLNPIAKQDRRLRAQAIERISTLLSPLADWLLSQSAKTIVLHCGGYYQTFPIWSLGELPNAISKFDVKIFQVPSQALASAQKRRTAVTPLTFAIQDAAEVAGSVSLQEASREVEWLSSTMPAEWSVTKETATPSTVQESVATADFIHFSGHSIAGIEPTDSFLNTHAGPLRVESILEDNSSAQLVFLSSCESGLPQNYSMQDEFLSIQSAYWYIGVRYTLGTYWAVTDRAAGLFSRYFYESLVETASLESFEIGDAIYTAWVTAMTRLKNRNPNKLSDWASFGLLGIP